MLTKSEKRRTAIQLALVFGLALAAGCESVPAPATESQQQALSGPWMYFPVDVNRGLYAGYDGYNCGVIPGFGPYQHNAYDIVVNIGEPVRAVSSGTLTVKETRCARGDLKCGGACGNYVVINHGDMDGDGLADITKYCHLSSVKVRDLTPKIGDVIAVSTGDLIGYAGDTGSAYTVPHLHFAWGSGGDCVRGYNAYCTPTACSGCGAVVASCKDPGCPAGIAMQGSGGPHYQCNNVASQWVTSGGVVAFAKNYTPPPTCTPSHSAAWWCHYYQNLAGSDRVCGPNYTDDCNRTIDCGSCPSGYTCNNTSGLCARIPPTCPPSGGGWVGAGRYCWDQPGMSYTAANHLYNCIAPGAAAQDWGACGEGCRHMPSGQNDICYNGNCGAYRWWNTWACGWDNVGGNPMINYHCYYGSKIGLQWCTKGCAWGYWNDYCY